MKIFAHGWSDRRDGPGYRLIYYLKGCNFRCLYCGNPEGIAFQDQILFYPKRVGTVPVAECCDHQMKCDVCRTFECVKVWRHPAFEISGKAVAPAEILQQTLAARHMIDGVTFGGGEPCCQMDELLETIKLLRDHQFSVAVESNAGSGRYRELFGKVDVLISDLKAVTPERHLRLTGVDNQTVLANLRLAAQHQKNLLIRIPLVTGYNTLADELSAIIQFLGVLRSLRDHLSVQLLPLHHLGEGKYAALRQADPLAQLASPDPEIIAGLAQQLRDQDIRVLGMTIEKGEQL